MRTIIDVMTGSPITAARTDSIGGIRDAMAHSGVHCIPVTDSGGHPVGIVSSFDLVEVNSDSSPLEDLMTKKVFTIGAHQSIPEAATMMRTHFVHHLVVVDVANEVVGVVSSLDLLEDLLDID